MKRILVIMLTVLMAAAVLAGCSPAAQAPAAEGTPAQADRKRRGLLRSRPVRRPRSPGGNDWAGSAEDTSLDDIMAKGKFLMGLTTASPPWGSGMRTASW
jgi:hypothetical protein